MTEAGGEGGANEEQDRRSGDAESFWLRKAKVDLLQRDAADAVNEAEALLKFVQGRLDALIGGFDAPGERKLTRRTPDRTSSVGEFGSGLQPLLESHTAWGKRAGRCAGPPHLTGAASARIAPDRSGQGAVLARPIILARLASRQGPSWRNRCPCRPAARCRPTRRHRRSNPRN